MFNAATSDNVSRDLKNENRNIVEKSANKNTIRLFCDT